MASRRNRPAKRTATRSGRPSRVVDRPINWFKHSYGRAFLASSGPLIIARLRPPSAIENAIAANGEPIPAPVQGVVLVDTGATVSCVSLVAAGRLALNPTRLSSGYGLGGSTQNPVFFARLDIEISDGSRNTLLTWEKEFLGIPDLEKPAAAAGIRFDGVPVEMIGLLGRDVLSMARMEYDGINGEVKIRFDLAQFPVRQ